MIIRLIDKTELDLKIEITPSGPERNALCDLNIMSQAIGKDVASKDLFLMTDITPAICQTLEDSEYYYITTSGGYRECRKGFIIKSKPKEVKSILIQHG